MKFFKRFMAVFMLLAMFLPLLAGCKQKADPETRPLTMGIQNPDQVFNPFFSTSAMDSTIIGMTQIGMLASDKDGNLVWGDDEPVVVKDCDTTEAADGTYTDYSFIIKNGIKFSDGTPLTIKDVLFNLYVYLDPVYTGSSTIYSTDIVGLQAYRQNNPDASDDGASAFEERFISAARQRRSNLIEFIQVNSKSFNPPAGWQPREFSEEDIKMYREDVAYVAKEFRKELESDWNSASVEDYKDEGFTEKWQVFLMLDAGYNFYKKDPTNPNKDYKDEQGKKQVDPVEISKAREELNTSLASQANSNLSEEEKIRNWAIDCAYGNYFSSAVVSGVYDETVFDSEHIAATIEELDPSSFSLIVSAWATADTVLTKFVADAKSAQLGNGERKVPTITGITSSAAELDKVTKDFSGKDLGEPHDILKIRINNIDPKAIWNFSFNVAPMHYYSGTWNGVNYIEQFDAAKGNFGFKYSEKDFFDQVINSPSKVGLPVGAGVYMASTNRGGVAKSASDFFDGSNAYYERNPYFYTLFGNDTSKNAKIKLFRYRVVESDQVINQLITGGIDIGEPNATPENGAYLDSKGFTHVEPLTAGYGYVGINPRFVPSVEVRRAIIKAMNTSIIKENYYKDLCTLINRPMSMANWAFPKDATTYVAPDGTSYAFDSTGNEIKKLVEDAGYTIGNDGIYHKTLKDGSDHKLSYKFTIAGSSIDHPAYSMFVTAADILNNLDGPNRGFEIKVVTSQQALSDLSAGKLTVWAAAWSSTIDPDMYQVYHKDSNATSVNNWGYPQIKASNRTLYPYEYSIMNELSDKIDEGRTTTDQNRRKVIYAQALDLVMEMAVEFPTYQRRDMTAFDAKLLDRNTMTADPSPYEGLLNRIWELNYVK